MIIGDLKSLLPLWENLALNQRYRPYITNRDFVTIRDRARNEGISFFTQTLPLYGKALDRYHSLKEWVTPPGFAAITDIIQLPGKDLMGTAVTFPLLFGKAIKAALKGDSIAVDCIRQLTYIFYKLEVVHEDQTVSSFLSQFKETDKELANFDFTDDLSSYRGILITNMRRIISEILCNTDPLMIRPCHGGGATANRTENKDKWHSVRYIPKLDHTYSYSDLFFFSPSHLIDEMDWLEKMPLMENPHARVCLVPKDSRGPRVISCEPTEYMYVQQGIMRKLYEVLETHYLTAGQINFSDQSINRELARQASMDDDYSTLDLSEASDRVSLNLVRAVFPANWVQCFEACRSEETDLPDGTVVKLNKFAPMGSACCFPVEALVFWACAEAIIRMHYPYYKGETLKGKGVFVYGDDIIMRSIYFDFVVEGLERLGLLVNRDKSYKDGPFRESCGGDYHNGYDVTPVRVREPLLSEGIGVAAYADLANLFIAKYGYDGARSLITCIEEFIEYQFPRSELGLPGTIRSSPSASNNVFFSRRWNKNYHRMEHKVLSQVMGTLNAHPANWRELHRMELTRNFPGRDMSGLTNILRLIEDEDIFEDRYVHPDKIRNKQLRPGQYADVHTARDVWKWIWLG